MKPYQHLLNRFKCPKCNNTASLPKEVSLSRVSEKFLGGHSEKYLYLSCSLCGYTEIYNLKIIVQECEREAARAQVTEPQQS